ENSRKHALTESALVVSRFPVPLHLCPCVVRQRYGFCREVAVSAEVKQLNRSGAPICLGGDKAHDGAFPCLEGFPEPGLMYYFQVPCVIWVYKQNCLDVVFGCNPQ